MTTTIDKNGEVKNITQREYEEADKLDIKTLPKEYKDQIDEVEKKLMNGKLSLSQGADHITAIKITYLRFGTITKKKDEIKKIQTKHRKLEAEFIKSLNDMFIIGDSTKERLIGDLITKAIADLNNYKTAERKLDADKLKGIVTAGLKDNENNIKTWELVVEADKEAKLSDEVKDKLFKSFKGVLF